MQSQLFVLSSSDSYAGKVITWVPMYTSAISAQNSAHGSTMAQTPSVLLECWIPHENYFYKRCQPIYGCTDGYSFGYGFLRWPWWPSEESCKSELVTLGINVITLSPLWIHTHTECIVYCCNGLPWINSVGSKFFNDPKHWNCCRRNHWSVAVVGYER